jgi:hypothetical protein
MRAADIVATGPQETLIGHLNAAVQLSHSCHSCIAQHLQRRNDGTTDSAIYPQKGS